MPPSCVVPSLYLLACKACDPEGFDDFITDRTNVWDGNEESCAEVPRRFQPDIVVERVPSPPNKMYLFDPPRFSPFLYRLAYINQDPRETWRGVIRVLDVVEERFSGILFWTANDFTPLNGEGKASAQELVNRVEELDRGGKVLEACYFEEARVTGGVQYYQLPDFNDTCDHYYVRKYRKDRLYMQFMLRREHQGIDRKAGSNEVMD